MSGVRVVHFTDPHLFGDPAGALRGTPTLPALEAALAHARSGPWPPDAIVLGGDLVQDDPGGYAHVRRLFGSLGVPVAAVPGNHDDPGQLRRALAGAPFVLDPWLDLGAWRIVLLDSVVPGFAGGRLASNQLELLETALSGCSGRHALVCLHHHPVPMGSRWLDAVGLENAAALFARLDAHAHVRVLLWGHVHQAFHSTRRGTVLLATPATCAQFLPRADDFAVDSRPPAYRTLELRADGSVRTEVVWLDAAADAALPACPAA